MYTFGMNRDAAKRPLIRSSFIFFVIIIFFYSLGDSTMSFMAPNIIESIVHNSFYMGIIFSLSSVVGFFIDYLLSNNMKEKSFYVYSLVGIILSSVFPLILLGKTSLIVVILSMGIWGIYYELLLFAKSNYIHHYLAHDQHDFGWAVMNAFSSLAYIIGPTLALSLLSIGAKIPLYTAIFMQLITIFGILIFKLIYGKHIRNPYVTPEQTHSLKKGLIIWAILEKKLFPVLLFLLFLTIVDSTFWTAGAVLANSLRNTSALSDFFYVVYLLPAFIVAPLGIKVSKRIGKKRTAYSAGLLAGISFGTSIFQSDFQNFMIHIGIGAIFFSITVPEIKGAIEDYCERLGHNANTLVGLTNSMSSLGFVIGPIIAGGLAALIGEQKAFGAIGWLLALISLIFLIITPRKIHLPQKQIKESFAS